MSEEHEPKTPSQDVDEFLLGLVTKADESKTETLNLSLVVNGLIVSGQLAGVNLYQEGIFDLVAQNQVKRKEEFIFPEQLPAPWKPRFIHLKDAKIYHPGLAPIPSNEGVWWRGRLSAVNGFWFGRLTIDT